MVEIMDYEKVIERLDLIVKLLAMNILNDEGTQKEKVIKLSKIGMQPKEIANILNTSSNSVSVALSGARKEGLL